MVGLFIKLDGPPPAYFMGGALAFRLEFGPADSTGKDCPSVLAVQSEMLAQYRPGVVLWWSRHEGIDRYAANGTLLIPSTEAFREAQKRDFIAAADRFTADGATLVVVLTERPGVGIMTRDQRTRAYPLIRNMVYHDEYRQHFNQIVKEVAATRSNVRTIDGDSLFCAPGPGSGPGALCDDSRGSQGYLRPDGSHVNNDLFGEQVSADLMPQFERASGRGASAAR